MSCRSRCPSTSMRSSAPAKQLATRGVSHPLRRTEPLTLGPIVHSLWPQCRSDKGKAPRPRSSRHHRRRRGSNSSSRALQRWLPCQRRLRPQLRWVIIRLGTSTGRRISKYRIHLRMTTAQPPQRINNRQDHTSALRSTLFEIVVIYFRARWLVSSNGNLRRLGVLEPVFFSVQSSCFHYDGYN